MFSRLVYHVGYPIRLAASAAPEVQLDDGATTPAVLPPRYVVRPAPIVMFRPGHAG